MYTVLIELDETLSGAIEQVAVTRVRNKRTDHQQAKHSSSLSWSTIVEPNSGAMVGLKNYV